MTEIETTGEVAPEEESPQERGLVYRARGALARRLYSGTGEDSGRKEDFKRTVDGLQQTALELEDSRETGNKRNTLMCHLLKTE